MKYSFVSNDFFNYRHRPLVAVPVDEPSKTTTDGPKHTFLAPRARHDRARSEAIIRNASPMTSAATGLPTGAQTLSFSNEVEMIPSTSRSYKTLSAVNKYGGIMKNDLYRSVLNGSINPPLSLRGTGSGRDHTNNSISSTTSRVTYFHHPSNTIKSSIRSRHSSTFRNNY